MIASGTIETDDLGCYIDENLREVARWDPVPTVEIADGLPVVVASDEEFDPFWDDDPTEVRSYQEIYDSTFPFRPALNRFFKGFKIPGLE